MQSPQPSRGGWVKVSKNTLNGVETLSAFLQKQSSKSNSGPKTYKKKWCWFQPDSGLLYYHHSGAIPNNSTAIDNSATNINSNNNSLNVGYQIKSIQIENCTIEQSSSTRLEFIIMNSNNSSNNKKQWIWRANDEPTVLQWVNGLTTWKQRNHAQNNAQRRPVAAIGFLNSSISSIGNTGSSADLTSGISPPLSPRSTSDCLQTSSNNQQKQAISDQFLKNLSINVEAGQDRASGKQSFGAVKIRQLLVRQNPPLDSEQANYILSSIYSQIAYLQECYDEIQHFTDQTINNTGAPANTNTHSGPNKLKSSGIINSSGGNTNDDEDYDENTNTGIQDEGMFSLLPDHLSLYILSYLEPNQLLICEQVSQKWYSLASNNQLWMRFTKHLQSPASIFDTTQNWQSVYLNNHKHFNTPKEKNMNRALSIYGLPSANSNKSVKEGFLYKRGEDILRIWKKRYFVLKENCLFYFQHPYDNFPCGMIPLHTSFKVKRVSPSTRKHCFKIIHDGLQSCKQYQTVERKEPYYLSAENEEECNAWMTIVHTSILKSDRLATMTPSTSTSKDSPNQQHRSLHNHGSKSKGHAKKTSNSTPINLSSLAGSSDSSGSLSPPNSPLKQSLETKIIFGVPITSLMNEQSKTINLPMPFILYRCFQHIKSYGLQEEGLFRVSGSVLEIELLKSKFEQDIQYAGFDLIQHDIHAITGLVKSFFRKLTTPLVPSDLDEYATAVSLAQSQTQEQKIQEYKFIFESLDPTIYNIFQSLLNLLRLTVENKTTTKMTEENILIVVMPTLKCSPVLVNNGIRFYSQIFEGLDPLDQQTN